MVSRRLCEICRLSASKQREIATDYMSGVSYVQMREAHGHTKRALEKHFTKCTSGHAAIAGWASKVDYEPLIALLHRTAQTVEEQMAKWVKTGGVWGTTDASDRIVALTDRLSNLYMHIDNHQRDELSAALAELAGHYVADMPVTASGTIQTIMARYPAARSALTQYEAQQQEEPRNDQQDGPPGHETKPTVERPSW